MRRLDLPAGTPAGEVSALVQLRLEELSPFPLDQLHFGYLCAEDGSAAFAYAAYRRRLPAGQAESWVGASFVLPDFAPVLRLRFNVATLVVVRSENVVAALYFEGGRELPLRGAARALAEGASSQEMLELVKRLALEGVSASGVEEAALDLVPLIREQAQGLAFELIGSERGGRRDVLLPGEDCWAMDIRDAEFIQARRKQLRVDLLFWRVVQAGVGAMVLLLLGEILLLGGSAYARWQERRITQRQPEVQAIDAKNSLAIGLQTFRERAVHPFDMFRVLGRGRPASLYFTEAKLEGLRMEIRGEASNMAEYNNYITALRSVAELAEPPTEVETKIRDNTTAFTIVVKFRAGAFAAAQPSKPAP